MFFVSADNTGVTGAIVVSADSSRVKVDCFHTLETPLVSADSAGFKWYTISYYWGQFGGICTDGWINPSHFGQFPSVY